MPCKVLLRRRNNSNVLSKPKCKSERHFKLATRLRFHFLQRHAVLQVCQCEPAVGTVDVERREVRDDLAHGARTSER